MRWVAWMVPALAALAVLGSCGGGGGGGTGSSGSGGGGARSFTFVDTFSNFPNGQWVASNASSVGVDNTRGHATPPCLQIWGGEDMTSNAPQGAMDVSGGVVFTVRIAFPDPTVYCATSTFAFPVVNVNSRNNAFPIAAWVNFKPAPCNDPLESVRLEYQAGVVSTFEIFPPGTFVPGRFYEFTFELVPNGPVRWYRDGVVKAAGTAPSLAGEIEIELTSPYYTTMQDPICFDDVGVLR